MATAAGGREAALSAGEDFLRRGRGVPRADTGAEGAAVSRRYLVAQAIDRLCAGKISCEVTRGSLEEAVAPGTVVAATAAADEEQGAGLPLVCVVVPCNGGG